MFRNQRKATGIFQYYQNMIMKQKDHGRVLQELNPKLRDKILKLEMKVSSQFNQFMISCSNIWVGNMKEVTCLQQIK